MIPQNTIKKATKIILNVCSLPSSCHDRHWLTNSDTKPTNKSTFTAQNKYNIFYFEEVSICQDRQGKLLIMNEYDRWYWFKSNVSKNKLILWWIGLVHVSGFRFMSSASQRQVLLIWKNDIIFGKMTSRLNWAWMKNGWVVGEQCTFSPWCNSVDMRSIFCPPLTKAAKQN